MEIWMNMCEIIECNLCTTTTFDFLFSLYLSILSVNDAKTRLKKASRMSLFYLLSYYDTDKSEINIESIFKNCRGIPLCNLYISWIMIHVYDVFLKKVNYFPDRRRDLMPSLYVSMVKWRVWLKIRKVCRQLPLSGL